MSDVSWLWDWPTHIPNLISGLGVALFLTVTCCLIGYPIGFVLALLSDSRNRAIRLCTIVAVEIGRGFPALVLLYLVYRGLPQLGLLLDALPAAMTAITITAAAYSAEMIRASVAAVPKGQRDAADALGLGRIDLFRFVIVPQAARIAIPPLVTLTVSILHITSLASVITVAEIMRAAYVSGAINWRYMSVYLAAAFIYAVIAIPGAVLAGRLEKRIGVGHAPSHRLRHVTARPLKRRPQLPQSTLPPRPVSN